MKLYSYVVARDYGFAPNPFFGFCTLATCKPRIRAKANLDDWVLGTGCAERGRRGSIVYAMRVTDALTFNQYYSDSRFTQKKPNLRGSKKTAFGDNIYFTGDDAKWRQLDSHHSYENGVINLHNIRNDTQTDRVLVSNDFAYWGGEGPTIPATFRDYEDWDICALRNHKSGFPPALVQDFVAWFRSLGAVGYLGRPLDWSRTS